MIIAPLDSMMVARPVPEIKYRRLGYKITVVENDTGFTIEACRTPHHKVAGMMYLEYAKAFRPDRHTVTLEQFYVYTEKPEPDPVGDCEMKDDEKKTA